MYTRHTARFLLIWLLAMPMSLYHEFRRAEKIAIPLVVPVISFFSAIFLFGIEELGVQIEEPFSILPLGIICNEIQYAGEDLLADSGVAWFADVEVYFQHACIAFVASMQCVWCSCYDRSPVCCFWGSVMCLCRRRR